MTSAVDVRPAPETGQLVSVRDRRWVVVDVERSTQPVDVVAADPRQREHLVTLTSVEEDALGDELRVIWELEQTTRILDRSALPAPDPERFDDPVRLDAFLDAVRWGAITSADTRSLQAPFRSGITIEDYQLDPVVRALSLPRANLLIADDVGLGKTIEAGLVVQELLLRHRARTVLVVCPASLCVKWRDEMAEKFGLEFRIVDAECLRQLRRSRGPYVNPWTHFPRLITSIDWLKRDRPMRLLGDALPAGPPSLPRTFDLLIVDEVHGCAPSGRGRYATDSRRTAAIRRIAPHFEHRLFLSATPHNGYPESFGALLELLDDQRFARGVRPDRAQLERVMVGLWVGRQATPNRTEEADAWVKQQRGASGFRLGGSSPAQLTTCPWCGSPINEARDIRVDLDRRRTLLFCGDVTGACPFTARRRPDEGLPVVVVDEEVYRLLPALLIGTVDGFAQMPWQGPTMALFGRVSGRCQRHGFRSPDLEDSDSHPRRGALPAARTVPAGPLRPPDLIIQDELHLIAGPLGSLVGLYETAVDRLCTWEADGRPVRPKVVASTATVRRAGHQVHRLFLRQVKVFPPPGLDAEDSFFAVQRPTGEVPGRRYLGICAHGRRFKHVLIRVFVAELAAAQTLFDKYGGAAAVDPYMTLVGYFNSLRELGGMRRLVEDDVASRLGQIDAHGLAKRRRPEVQELTSRLGSSGIPRVLDQLQVPFRSGPRPAGATWPIDVLLATNMIAVGVDVPRLGAMVVGGQPKNTAEYIQATSRIGRAHPGLVLTVLNWARPRDLSHYETFEHYHATFYRQVEALSVTPFAARALDRGLTAVLASLVRLSGTELNANLAAGQLDRHDEALKRVVAAVRARAEQVADEPGVGEEVTHRLETRLDQWDAQAAKPHRRLGYRERRGQGDVYGLLREPGIGAWDVWTCPTSLRDVEAEIGLLLSEADLGDATQPAFEPATAGDQGDGR